MSKSKLTNLQGYFAFLVFLCGITSDTFAQEVNPTSKIEEKTDYYVSPSKSVKLSLLSPMLTFQYEKPIGPKTVFDVNAGIALNFSFGSYSGSFNDTEIFKSESISVGFSPILSLAVKNYYNIDKRQEKGKSIVNNTANYFGGRLFGILVGWHSYQLEINGQKSKQSEFSSDGAIGLTAMWGMNRHLKNNFNFNLEVGPAVVLSDGDAGFGAWINIGFSKSF